MRSKIPVGLALLLAAGWVQSPQRPTFRADAPLVRVDVIVSDSGGDFIDDLEIDDFRLYEDGQLQRLLSLQLVDVERGEVTVRSSSTFGATALAAEPVELVETDVAALSAIVYLIDGPTLDPTVKGRFADIWARVLVETEDATLTSPRAVYMIDSIGQLREITPLTRNTEALRASGQTIADLPLSGTSRMQRLIEVAETASQNNAPAIGGGGGGLMGDDPGLRLAQMKARAFEAEERSRSFHSFETLERFANSLSARGGRTALMWVSSGVKITQGGPFLSVVAVAADPAGTGRAIQRLGGIAPDQGLLSALERVQKAANSANVSIYAIDPSLLNQRRGLESDASTQNTFGPAGSALASPLVRGAFDGLRDSMRNAASATGGKALISYTDLRSAFRDIERDTGRFYLLAYTPPAPHGDGVYHEIDVEVEFDGAEVRHRAGYSDLALADRLQNQINAALALPGTADGLGIEIDVVRSWRPNGAANVMLALGLRPSEADFAIEEGNNGATELRSFQVNALVLDEDGEVIETTQQRHELRRPRARQQDRGNTDEANAASSDPQDSADEPYLVYRYEWTLPPGDYDIRVAALDEIGGHIGAASIGFDVPVSDDSWRVSDLALISGANAASLQPVVNDRAPAGVPLIAYVELIGGVQPILSGRLMSKEQIALGGDQEGADLGARLPATRMRRDTEGVFRGTMALPPYLPAGEYLLQVQVTDLVANRHHIFRRELQLLDHR